MVMKCLSPSIPSTLLNVEQYIRTCAADVRRSRAAVGVVAAVPLAIICVHNFSDIVTTVQGTRVVTDAIEFVISSAFHA